MYENNRGPEEYLDHKKELTFKRILPLIIFFILLLSFILYYTLNLERDEKNDVNLDPQVNRIEDYISKHYITRLDELFNRKTAVEDSNDNSTYEIAGMSFEESFYKNTRYHEINSSIDSQQKIYSNKGTVYGTAYEIFLFQIKDEINIVAYTFDYSYLIEEEIK